MKLGGNVDHSLACSDEALQTRGIGFLSIKARQIGCSPLMFMSPRGRFISNTSVKQVRVIATLTTLLPTEQIPNKI